MKIGCIGWGSLIWKPEKLLVEKIWNQNGPILPIDYLRQSNNGRLTLVISQEATPITTLWAEMTTTDLNVAKSSLTTREGCHARNIGVLIKNEAFSVNPIHQAVHNWLIETDIDAVIWTNLPVKFNGVNGVSPTLQEALDYLSNLQGDSRTLAEDYIRKTPVQIMTAYRVAFQNEFGWTPLSDLESE